jgi:hypothetical protein
MYSVGEGAPSETVTFDFPIVGTEDPSNAVLVNALKGNYPNPFNPTTTLSYSVAKAGMVNLKVYNTKGQLVKTLVSAHQLAGKHTIVWDGTNDAGNLAASGLYLYRLETGKYSSTKKMMMMK